MISDHSLVIVLGLLTISVSLNITMFVIRQRRRMNIPVVRHVHNGQSGDHRSRFDQPMKLINETHRARLTESVPINTSMYTNDVWIDPHAPAHLIKARQDQIIKDA